MYNNRKKFNELYKGLINNEKRLPKENKNEDIKKGKNYVSYIDGKEYIDLSKHKENCSSYFKNYDSKRGYKRIINIDQNRLNNNNVDINTNNNFFNENVQNNNIYNQIKLNPRNIKSSVNNVGKNIGNVDFQSNFSKENISINNKVTEHQIQLSDIKLIKYIKPREFFKVKKEGLVDFFVNNENAIDFDKIVKVNMIEDIIR